MPVFVPCDGGWIEAITGPMFSGKSEELIRRLTRAQIANQSVAVYKPALDSRFSKTQIVSRSGAKIECTSLDNDGLEKLVGSLFSARPERFLNKDVYGFDEAQFFDEVLFPRLCLTLSHIGKRVIVAGLDTDYRGIPFRTMADMLAGADYVDKVNAVCMRCGDVATKTARIIQSDDRVVVGDTEAYMAMCRVCHYDHLIGVSNVGT